MSLFYSGRHRAAPTSSTSSRTVGLGVAAVAAAGIAAPAVISTSASAAPATVSTTTTFSGTVSYGDRGSTVKAIQRKVGVSADGVFGPATRNAVKRWQKRNNLAADGVVGPRTGAKMGLGRSSSSRSSSSSRPSSSSTARTNFSGLVRQGARGSIVKQIQRKVGVSADGVFGPATRSAVQRWQRSHGLTADGVVGSQTGSRMGLTGSSSGTSTWKPKKKSSPSRSTSRSSSRGSSVLGTAANYVGTPYRYGGTTPSGFDCSGYTQYVFGKHGKSLPRTAEAQRRAASRVSSPQPGDLVFFGAPAYHVGIYAGGGKMYDSGNSRVPVSKRAIWTSAVTYGRV